MCYLSKKEKSDLFEIVNELMKQEVTSIVLYRLLKKVDTYEMEKGKLEKKETNKIYLRYTDGNKKDIEEIARSYEQKSTCMSNGTFVDEHVVAEEFRVTLNLDNVDSILNKLNMENITFEDLKFMSNSKNTFSIFWKSIEDWITRKRINMRR